MSASRAGIVPQRKEARPQPKEATPQPKEATRISGWQRWMRAPATHWLHKLMFQVHLWLGIVFGLYVLMISISGSAVVLRPYIPLWFVNSTVEPVAGVEFTEADLSMSLARAYKGSTVVAFDMPRAPGQAMRVTLEEEGKRSVHYYDHYLEVDLGPLVPWQMQAMEWTTRLHDELLMGSRGMTINGVGGLIFMLMMISGALIWWRGRDRWHKGLLFSRKSPRSLMWQLHCVLGIWSLPMIIVWGVTAVYFAWPYPFDVLIEWMDGNKDDVEIPDAWLLLMIKLHFGRFQGALWASIIWIFLGLLPALHFITGLVMWYRRVARSWLQQSLEAQQAQTQTG